jgi:hypothetical protein
MADIILISCPVHLHGWKNISIIDGEDSVNSLIQLGFLIFQNLREVLGIIRFDELTDLLMHVLLPLIVSDQRVQGELLDPGGFWRNVPTRHDLIHGRLWREKDVRRAVVTIHAVHEADGQFVQFFVRNADEGVLIDCHRSITPHHLHPWNVL